MTWLTVFLFSHGHETFESKTRGRGGIFDSMAGGAGLWVSMVLDRRQLVSVAPIERVGMGSIDRAQPCRAAGRRRSG
ncbi:hypothetical protein [Streptomyces sp. NBC_01268]|uniref:hypothetical protein n=1 Tax=Streptomyces sp. NBC_01268 TaxID=2903806 RepID=UPI002E2FB0ED|nr:hypothetical protein [Streptomyces sp. NBC_01268]